MQIPKVAVFLFLLLFSIVIISNTGCKDSNIASKNKEPSLNTSCADGVIIVEQQSDAPAQLSLRETKCEASYSKIQLMFKNVSDKPISGYDISWVEDYDHKKGVESSQGTKVLRLNQMNRKKF